jgi:hypothetical protein
MGPRITGSFSNTGTSGYERDVSQSFDESNNPAIQPKHTAVLSANARVPVSIARCRDSRNEATRWIIKILPGCAVVLVVSVCLGSSRTIAQIYHTSAHSLRKSLGSLRVIRHCSRWDLDRNQSCRSALTGSIRAAREAGYKAAAIDTSSANRIAPIDK